MNTEQDEERRKGIILLCIRTGILAGAELLALRAGITRPPITEAELSAGSLLIAQQILTRIAAGSLSPADIGEVVSVVARINAPGEARA